MVLLLVTSCYIIWNLTTKLEIVRRLDFRFYKDNRKK